MTCCKRLRHRAATALSSACFKKRTVSRLPTRRRLLVRRDEVKDSSDRENYNNNTKKIFKKKQVGQRTGRLKEENMTRSFLVFFLTLLSPHSVLWLFNDVVRLAGAFLLRLTHPACHRSLRINARRYIPIEEMRADVSTTCVSPLLLPQRRRQHSAEPRSH